MNMLALPALRQQHPTPVSSPPTIAVIPLLVNSKPHAPFDRRWATLFQICKEYPSCRILPLDLCSFSLVTIAAKVRGTERDHSFLFTFYATIDAVKWLYFRNTNHLSLIPSPILIWDPGLNFGAMVVAPTPWGQGVFDGAGSVREQKITTGAGVKIANQGYRRKQSPKERKNGEIVQQRKAPGTMRQILLLQIIPEAFMLLGSLYM